MDLTTRTLPAHVLSTLPTSAPPRLRYLLTHLLPHLHTFLLTTRPTPHEWHSALFFLSAVAAATTPTRNELLLLSDILGASSLLDLLNHPVPASATPTSVLGPFHTHAPRLPNGADLTTPDAPGDRVLFRCSVTNTAGEPLRGVRVDVWETDATGKYDVQYAGEERTDCRGVLRSDAEGRFWFRGVRPVSYAIPTDGPVGGLLRLLGRHPYRPAHVHFLLRAEGYEELVTALFMQHDEYIDSDVVFGVKKALVVGVEEVGDEVRREFGLEGKWGEVRYEFVMVGTAEAEELRVEEGMRELAEMGVTEVEWVGGLPVMPVD